MTPILATLGYLLSLDKKSVLLVRRDTRPDDLHFGKYNGLGGKLEPTEDIVAGMKREVLEETGLVCDHLALRGTISWPGFGKAGADWFGFVFLIDRWHGQPHAGNREGSLHWIERDKILDLPLWEGDRFFLPLVFDANVQQFHGVMPYRDGKPLSWKCTVL